MSCTWSLGKRASPVGPFRVITTIFTLGLVRWRFGLVRNRSEPVNWWLGFAHLAFASRQPKGDRRREAEVTSLRSPQRLGIGRLGQ